MNPDPFSKWIKPSTEKTIEDPFGKWMPKQQESIESLNEQPQEMGLKQHAQEFIESPGTQIGLGLTQAATSPLDVFKMYAIGEGLSAIDEAEEAHFRLGIPYDKKAKRREFLEQVETYPTQSKAEEFFEKETGLETKSKDRFTRFLRGAAEFLGLQKGKAKVPDLANKTLTQENQALRQTAEKFGLRKFAGAETEKPPNLTPIVSPERQAKLTTELSETSKKAIDDIISQKLPVKKMQDLGVNLEDAYTTAYGAAKKTATDMGEKPINISNVIEWIDSQIAKTKGSAPSLSKQDKVMIDILEHEKKNLIPKSKDRIDIITGEKIPPSAKKATANQVVKQYQNYNDNVKGIWKKPEFSGSENTVKNVYAGLNEQLMNAVSRANPTLGNELKFANNIFSQTAKLNQIENILGKSFKDGYNPKQLEKTLGSKRDRSFLERNLGKDSVQDLEKIANYGKKVEERILDRLKNPKTVAEYLNNMTPMQLGLLVGFKGHVGAPFYMAKALANRVQGLIFTRDATKKSWVDFMQQASKLGSNPSNLNIVARQFGEAISKEFGSEENLLKIASENKED